MQKKTVFGDGEAKTGKKVGKNLVQIIVKFIHFLPLMFFVLFEVRINGGGNGRVGGVSRPKRNNFPLYAALLSACNERMAQIVEMMSREEVFEMFREHAGGNSLDFFKVNEREKGREHGRNGNPPEFLFLPEALF